MLAQLLKTSIVMISNVGEGLAQFLSNLGECVALEEMQPERLPLILDAIEGIIGHASADPR